MNVFRAVGPEECSPGQSPGFTFGKRISPVGANDSLESAAPTALMAFQPTTPGSRPGLHSDAPPGLNRPGLDSTGPTGLGRPGLNAQGGASREILI